SGTPARVATEPSIGYRTNNALIAHEENIVKPKDASDEFQVEGELVAVIGTKARHLSPENALSCVLGYTIGNDVSQRTWQIQDGSLWRAKNSDTFKPMGPWIATDLDPNNLETTIRINGQVQVQFNTRHMLFDAASHIAKISRYSTLYPGDVVWLGAEGATPNMRPGDVVEIEISGIGPSGTMWWPRSRRVYSPATPCRCTQNVGVCDYGVYSLGTDGLTGVTRGVWRWRDRPGVGAYHRGRVSTGYPSRTGVGDELF